MREIWELVLIDERGREQARALRIDSKETAQDLANQWNREKAKFRVGGRWKVSRIEGMVTDVSWL